MHIRTRIGILGGSFNPIHVGHLILAQHAAEAFEFSRVLFVPCAKPAHKSDRHLIEGSHRLAMIERAVEWNPFFEVRDLELRRGGVSYAVDTVTELHRQQPEADLVFIIGLDMLPDLHKWKRIEVLLDLCRFVTFGRPGIAPPEAADLNLPDPWPERLLRDVTGGRQLDISSTDIRYRVAEGLSIRYLVPLEVELYIAEHGLYRR